MMPINMDEHPVSPAASPVAKDGSLIEIYRRVPGTAEVDIIAALLEPSSTVLDLGAGAGRIADPLAELGHQVTAVDDSTDMLAHVQHARTIRSSIEKLRLGEKFDAVLLCSSLLNYPGTELRRDMLATVAHHLKPTGKAIIQWRSPHWFTQWPRGTYHRTVGTMRQTMTILTNEAGFVAGEFTMEDDEGKLTQQFQAHRVSGEELKSLLDQVGLRLDTDDPEANEWLEASLAH
ncbi:Ubiquinone biosynthesis O-methyltransferase [Mycobacterium simulans]|uniref:class I SAM-dependent methyltransferase n=1 Tax=Mycobacterium simulans TaxID=627089 RepID=UPI00199069CE|nr:class I SAM-dependent methyltransferase [Mycobacterium simulans]SON63553.1 Ubiquinone biosynthesis O-methyltransferase [Mycobacterium simulans]